MNDIQNTIARLNNIELKDNNRLIFDGLSIAIPRHKITAIVGLESAHSLLLLQIMTGSLKPSIGNIMVNGSTLSTMDASQLHAMQKHIGIVLTSDIFDPAFSVYENIKFILDTYAPLPTDLAKDLIFFVLAI